MLSIVIPVHNSEKYLRRCIDSIVNQTYRDIEIILVENNSTDSSANICEEYKIRDKRVKFFREYKEGAAAARNCGIYYAKGEYITFVDSDDYLVENAYEHIMYKIEETKADLVCYSFMFIDENERKLNWYTPNLSQYNKKSDICGADVASIYLTSRDIEGFGWNKVFCKSIFIDNDIKFDETKKSYEDMAILFDAICCCNKAVLLPERLYFYRQVSNSLSHGKYVRKDIEYNDSVNHIIKRAESIGLKKQAEVFWLSRKIYSLYEEYKCHIQIMNGSLINRSELLYDIWLIVRYYRSEKIKMIFKLLVVAIIYCR
jgi:glycosyltransferase involved in cell wall biosynthesis